MRLTRRIRSMEQRAACGTGCTLCRGAGWPAVMIAGAPPEARPETWPVGCRRCRRVNMDAVTWIGLGANPTVQEARTFLEAI